ncbi:MAG: O-unit flippase [Geobacteraceae bacterium GWC2_58_44]|nr:MAG: O-unit flippase [Geobacteraceae bacterium GWC2_58_44]HBG05762.1 flippase [Geobacter sp.]
MNARWTRYLPELLREKLDGRQELQQVVVNTGWLFFDNIIRMGVGLFVSIWVTRYLGPERFGALSYATAFAFIFSSVGALGLDWVVVRNLVRSPEQRDEILGSAFALKLLGGIATFGLSVGAIVLIRPDDRLSTWLVSVIALGTVFQAFGVINFWFQSRVQAKYSAYARSISFLIISLVKIVLIQLEAPLTAFAWAALAEVVFGAAGLLAAYRISGQHLKAWRSTTTMAKELLRDSWPLLLTDIVMLAYRRIDQVMIGEMVGSSEVGIYAVAVLLAEVWLFIPMAITSSVFPGVVEARQRGEELFQDRLQRYYNLMSFLGWVVAVPVTLVANWAVLRLFGPSYSMAGPMLTGLIWGGLFINLSIARSSFLTIMNWTRLHFITDLLGCLLNVALNLFLIPRYGGMGAVIASLISYWFVAHGSCFLFKPLLRTGTMLTRAMLYPKIW